MSLQRAISIGIVGFALLACESLAAFQTEQTLNPETQKAKRKRTKSKEDTASSAATPESARKAKSKAAGAANREAEESPAQVPETSPTDVTRANRGKTAASLPAHTVSESEIAAARDSGKVWVNTDTGVYHKGGRWYGATKHGKFMTEEEAAKAGYRESKTK